MASTIEESGESFPPMDEYVHLRKSGNWPGWNVSGKTLRWMKFIRLQV